MDAMPIRTRDLRVESIRPLLPPAILLEELPLGETAALAVNKSREEVARILRGQDDRLVVVVGPCSIHDPRAAMDYARRLHALAAELASDLRIVMRVYFEKPRTTVGWKGLINDPHLDGSFAINEGLRVARRLLLDLAELGLPAGCEFLDPITPQFTVGPGDVGRHRRPHHREPGAPRAGLGAARCRWASRTAPTAACRSRSTPSGPPPIRTASSASPSRGWPASCPRPAIPTATSSCAAGAAGPNYDAIHVQKTLAALRDAGLPPRLMVDASHGNSEKDYRRQPLVVRDVAAQVAKGRRGIIGVMMESFLVDGRQDLTDRQPSSSTGRASPTAAWAGRRRYPCCASWPPPPAPADSSDIPPTHSRRRSGRRHPHQAGSHDVGPSPGSHGGFTRSESSSRRRVSTSVGGAPPTRATTIRLMAYGSPNGTAWVPATVVVPSGVVWVVWMENPIPASKARRCVSSTTRRLAERSRDILA